MAQPHRYDPTDTSPAGRREFLMQPRGPLPWPGQTGIQRLIELEEIVARCDEDLRRTDARIADLQAAGVPSLEEAAGRYLDPRTRTMFVDRLQAEDTRNMQFMASEKARQDLYAAQRDYDEDSRPVPHRNRYDDDVPLFRRGDPPPGLVYFQRD